jgi:hypothetical protein
MACNNDNWGDQPDFFSPTIESCDQNLLAIRIFGIILAVFAGFAFPIKFYFMYLRGTHPMSNRTVQIVQTVYGFLAGAFDFTHCIFGILKAINPGVYLLGNSSGGGGMYALLFCMTVSFFWLMQAVALNLTYFLSGISRLITKESQERIRVAVEFVQRYGFLCAVIAVAIGILPAFAYVSPAVTLQLNLAYLIGYWILIVLQVLIDMQHAACYMQHDARCTSTHN